MNDAIVPVQNLIYEIRGKKVMLDFDLAKLYQVETKALNQAVKRNIKRFPPDFMFQLMPEEVVSMRSQIVTAPSRNVSAPPFAQFLTDFCSTVKIFIFLTLETIICQNGTLRPPLAI